MDKDKTYSIYSIYLIQNKYNLKIYIGYSYDPEQRWKDEEHFSLYKWFSGYEQPFYRAIRRDGWDNFSKLILETYTIESEAKEAEQFWIEYFQTNRNKYGSNYGYNLTDGGDGRVGGTQSEEWKINHSEFMKKDWERRKQEGWVSPLLGVPLSEERKKKLSENSMGKPGTNNGKIFDDEWCTKIGLNQKEKPRLYKRRFNEKTEKEICRLYVEEKYSTYKLGQIYNCSRTLISDLLDRHNIEKRQSNYTGHSNNCNIFTLEQELEICEKYKSNKYSRSQLAKEYKCGTTTIRNILIRYNILKP